jgi:preprotein translocase subunit SecD
MIKNLRWKVITILAVFAIFFAIGIYPILAQRYGLPAPGWLLAKQLKLGLDLQGGVHLVLRVHTGDALRTFTMTSTIVGVRRMISWIVAPRSSSSRCTNDFHAPSRSACCAASRPASWCSKRRTTCG